MEWINVNDKMPDLIQDKDDIEEGVEASESNYVIGRCDDIVYVAGVCYQAWRNAWYMYGDYGMSTVEVTHWMPFPKAE